MKQTMNPWNRGLSLLLAGFMASPAFLGPAASASSHMDAPLIIRDPSANTTDVYAFVDEDNGNKHLTVALRAFRGSDLQKFERHIAAVFQTLKDARPTAVDPVNAMAQVRATMAAGATVAERQQLALAAAEEFAQEDVEHCEAIGRHGAKLIRAGTHSLESLCQI